MGIIRYIATADAEITNAHTADLRTRASGSNMGAADTMGIFSIYGQSASGSLEKSRALVQFSTGSILRDRNNGAIPASGSVNFYLRMFNSAHPFTLPTNFTMKVAGVTGSSWIEGDGKDAEDYSDRGAVNWSTASLGTSRASSVITVSSAGDLLAGGATTVKLLATDGTEITATAHASATTTSDTNSPTFEVVAGSADDTAANIVTCLGINSRLRADRDEAVVTVTQEVAGTAGNTQVTLTDPGDDGLTVSDFAGGGEQTVWTSAGGDYHSDPQNPDTQYSQYFDSGTEDLEIDITHLVESWMSGEKANYGVGVMLDSSYEDGSAQRSYYVKRFHARNSEYFFKRPVLEVRWDSSVKDNRGNFYYSSSLASTVDNTNQLIFYNNVRGRLTSIPDIVGSTKLYVGIYGNSGSEGHPTGFPLQSPVTASVLSRGIYAASVTLLSQSLAAGEYLYDVWFGKGTGVASATITNTDNGELLSGGAAVITITTTDGTTVTATAHASVTTSDGSNAGTFVVGSSGSDTMVNLATFLNAHAKLTATSSGDVVTVTQATGGSAGNTTITIVDPDADGLSKTNFSGGAVNELGTTGNEFHTGSAFLPGEIRASNVNPTNEHVTTCTNMKNQYSRTETGRFRFYAREENWSPTIYSKASQAISGEIVEDSFWKIYRVIDGLTVVNYGTGSDKDTRLSYDKDGNYFDLEMSLLEGGYSYGITLLYSGSYGYTEQPEVFKFRVE